MIRRACALIVTTAVLIAGCADKTARLDPVSHRAVPVRPLVEYDGVEHAPYIGGQCAVCHDLTGSASFSGGGWPSRNADAKPLIEKGDGDHAGRLAGSVGEVCVACHFNMGPDTLDAEGLNVHAPVNKGECTYCHSPHRSPRAKLLREELVEGVCAGCHERSTHKPMAGLAESGDEDCFECHDPHGSVHPHLLREPMP